MRDCDITDRTQQVVFKLFEVVGPAVGKGAFKLRPDALVRVKLGRIGRQVLYVEPLSTSLQFSDHSSPMRDAVIPDDDDVSRDGPQELTQKGDHVIRSDVVS